MLRFESSIAGSLSATVKLSVINGVSKVQIFYCQLLDQKDVPISQNLRLTFQKKSSGQSIAVQNSIQHDHSTNPPVVLKSYIFPLPSVGLTQKRL